MGTFDVEMDHERTSVALYQEGKECRGKYEQEYLVIRERKYEQNRTCCNERPDLGDGEFFDPVWRIIHSIAGSLDESLVTRRERESRIEKLCSLGYFDQEAIFQSRFLYICCEPEKQIGQCFEQIRYKYRSQDDQKYPIRSAREYEECCTLLSKLIHLELRKIRQSCLDQSRYDRRE